MAMKVADSLNILAIFSLVASAWIWIILSLIYFYIWIDGGKLTVVEIPIIALVEMFFSMFMVFLCVLATYKEVKTK